ncbi:MAG: leucine-rich repeat protein [Oscillospiraceae bacterium]|nr:leucine-rich repeat protein [Oscillospiraceae bacterium]
MKAGKRLLAMLLCVLMFASMLPVQALAAEDELLPDEEPAQSEAGEAAEEPVPALPELADEPGEENPDPQQPGKDAGQGETEKPGENFPETEDNEEAEEEFAAVMSIRPVSTGNELTDSGECGDGVSWSLAKDGTLTIEGQGSVSSYPWQKSDVKKAIVRSGVTQIDANAFQNCENLVSVSLPATAQNISVSMFSGCQTLSDIYYDGTIMQWSSSMPASKMYFEGITVHCLDAAGENSVAFIKAGRCYSTGEVLWYWEYGNILHFCGNGTVPSDSSLISPWNSSEVTQIVFEEGITEIAASACTMSSKIQSVSFPSTLVSIGSRAFTSNVLKAVVIPEGVTQIEAQAFLACIKLEQIKLPTTIQIIGSNAIPVTATIEYSGKISQWISVDYNKNENIKVQCFDLAGQETITFYTCGKTDTGIYWYKDKEGQVTIDCVGFLGQITTSSPLYTIVRDSTKLVLSGSVTQLGDSFLAYISGPETVCLPDSITAIGEKAFQYCRSLNEIRLPANLTEIGNYTFASCSNLCYLELPETVSSIGTYAFQGCTSLENIELPAAVTTLGNYAFGGCTNLTSITLPENLTSVGSSAFRNCSGLKSVVFTGSLTQIGNWVFSGCSELESIVLPEGVTSIGLGAFGNCSKLSSVTLPSTLKRVEGSAFSECTSLSVVYFNGTRTQWNGISIQYDNEPLKNAMIIFAEDIIAATEIDARIEAIGEVTLESEETIAAIREAYDALNDTQKALVTKLAELESAERTLREQQQVKADAVDSLIEMIGEVTVTSGEAIAAAREAYEALTSGQKALVTKLSILEAAEAAYDALKGTVSGRVFSLDRDYLMLTSGESVQLHIVGIKDDEILTVTWSVENHNSTQTEAPLITIDQSGNVTAGAKAGTNYVLATISDGEGNTCYVRCRVDIVRYAQSRIVTSVRLVTTSAATELYKTEYSQIQVLPELAQNNVTANAAQPTILPMPEPEDNNGVAIDSAYFADSNTAARFTLRVVDDRTLEIVPTAGAINGALSTAKSYSSAIIVTVDGREFTTAAKLKLTVKKTLPTIKAKAAVLNSYTRYLDVQNLVFTGGTVLSARLNPAKTQPAWLRFDEEDRSVTYIGAPEAKQGKTTLNLLVVPEGWCVERSVAVTVSAKSTAPAITFKTKTLTLNPGTLDKASTSYSLKPALFAEEDVVVSRITEGKGASLRTYSNNTVLSVTIDSGLVTVSAPHIDNTAHTYTVYLSVMGKESSFVVKTLAYGKEPTLKLALSKTAKVMDLSVTGSPVVITATAVNLNKDVATYTVQRILNTTNNTGMNLATQFNINVIGNVITLTAARGVFLTGTYTATVSANYGGSRPAVGEISFKVQNSAKTPAPTVKLTAGGSIDVLRPGTAVTVKPTMTNLYRYELAAGDLTVTKTYDGATKKKVAVPATELFDVQVKDGAYVITQKSGAAVSHADKYSVQATVRGATSKAVTLKVVQGKAKLGQSTKAVTLLKTDRFSRGEVTLTPTDAALAIREVKLVSPADKSKTPYFDLVELGGGAYAVKFNGDAITLTKGSKTVKLQVFLEGNRTATPNATLSVKVSVK